MICANYFFFISIVACMYVYNFLWHSLYIWIVELLEYLSSICEIFLEYKRRSGAITGRKVSETTLLVSVWMFSPHRCSPYSPRTTMSFVIHTWSSWMHTIYRRSLPGIGQSKYLLFFFNVKSYFVSFIRGITK